MYNMQNQRFGRLTVLRRAAKRTRNQNIHWLCQCDCGNLVTVDGYSLRHGRVKSCGCLRRAQQQIASRQNPAFQKNIGRRENLVNPQQVEFASIHRSKRNRSGVIGVSYDQRKQRWFARLMVDHHYVLLKSFPDFESAVSARKLAERQYLVASDGANDTINA